MSLDPVANVVYRISDGVLRRDRRQPDVEFFTRLPIEECEVRLHHALETRLVPSLFSHGKPIGRLKDHRFYLYRRLNSRNPLEPVLHGWLISTPQGTYVSGTFRLLPIAIVFMPLLLAAVLGMGLVWIGLMIHTLLVGISIQFGLLYVLPLSLLMALDVWFNLRWSRSTGRYLADYLRRTLSASG